jgi:hypothetical protein
MSRQVTKRVLCISQSPANLEKMRSAISSLKYETFPAASPEQAVACSVGNHIVAVVMDSEFMTKEGEGWSVARSIKMVNPTLPIVLLEQGHNRDIPPGVDAVAPTVFVMAQKLAVLVARSSLA